MSVSLVVGTVNNIGTADWSVPGLVNLDQDKVYKQFDNELHTYAYRILSYESDRLLALAGLASLVFEITGGKYLAGLWKEDLHRGLL